MTVPLSVEGLPEFLLDGQCDRVTRVLSESLREIDDGYSNDLVCRGVHAEELPLFFALNADRFSWFAKRTVKHVPFGIVIQFYFWWGLNHNISLSGLGACVYDSLGLISYATPLYNRFGAESQDQDAHAAQRAGERKLSVLGERGRGARHLISQGSIVVCEIESPC
jgi:hypothetical protein